MKKLHEKVWMSNETSTAEERLEIFNLAYELGYNVWSGSCISTKNLFLGYCNEDNDFALYGSPHVEMESKPITHKQMLEIFANNEEDHSAVYRALSKVRGDYRFFNPRKTKGGNDHIVDVNEKINQLANDAIGQLIEFTKQKPLTISEAVDQLKQACKEQGITIEVLKFQMP